MQKQKHTVIVYLCNSWHTCGWTNFLLVDQIWQTGLQLWSAVYLVCVLVTCGIAMA